jgi:hypothetical protein
MSELQLINELINNMEVEGEEKKKQKKSYYVKLGTKSSGRPKRQLEEGKGVNDLRNEWNKNWREGRGTLCLAIGYIRKTYKDKLPQELLELPQKTDDELAEKHRRLTEKVKELKEQKYKAEYDIRKQKYAERKAQRATTIKA